MHTPVMGRLIYHVHCGSLVSQSARLPWNTLPSSVSYWLIASHHTVLISFLESTPPGGSLSSLLLGQGQGQGQGGRQGQEALAFLLPDSKSTSLVPGQSLLLHTGSWIQEFSDLTVWLGMALGFSWFKCWFVEKLQRFAWAERVFLVISFGKKSACWVLWLLAIICKYTF